MHVMRYGLPWLMVAFCACGTAGTGKTPATPPETPAKPTTETADTPPTPTDADLTCGLTVDCTEFLVWRWNDDAKGYCTGCATLPLNQKGESRLLEWYKPREGRGCPMHDCERPMHEVACVEGRCALVPITPAPAE